MTVEQLLREVRWLLSNPTRWTKYVMARNAAGQVTRATWDDAASWCLVGAMMCVTRDGELRAQANRLLRSVVPEGCKTLSSFNDLSSHEELLAVLDRAIEEAT